MGVWSGKGAVPPRQKFFLYFLYIKMVSFYALPVIFIDTVTSKSTLIKRVGVRTPWTPLDPPPRCRLLQRICRRVGLQNKL